MCEVLVFEFGYLIVLVLIRRRCLVVCVVVYLFGDLVCLVCFGVAFVLWLIVLGFVVLVMFMLCEYLFDILNGLFWLYVVGISTMEFECV